MATTPQANVIVPAVYEDMVQAEFVGQARVLNSGAVLTDDTLVGKPGDTVHFPKWGAISDLDDLTEGTAMTPEAMTTSDATATIKEAGKAVEITDLAELTGLGSAASEARRQFGVLAARKVDADLITAAQAAGAYTLAPSAGTALSWSVVVDAIGKFGDDWEPSDFAGLFIRSEQLGTLFKDSQFIDASKLGGNTPVVTGQIGIVGGVPVILTNRLATNKVLLMRRNALGALYKRRPIVEQDRDILKRTNVITTNVHYAVKRLNDKGVCTITLS